MFKKVEESMGIRRRDMEETKQTQTLLLEIKNIMSEIRNTLDGVVSMLELWKKTLVNLKTQQ